MISVVIPVYNCEQFLPSCLNSILNSNKTDFEIVAIDDGSTDQSGCILDSYSKKDARVRVIHQMNRGNSLTRQTGIEIAKGDMILFADADDELENAALDRLSELAEDTADIIGFGFSTDFVAEGYHLVRTYPDCIYPNSFDAAYYYLKNGGFNLLWNKMYRADLLRGHNDFPEMRITGQDFIFNCSVFPRAGKVQMISDVLYHYKKRAQETMVTHYIENGSQNMKRKGNALSGMLSEYNENGSSAYDDYMLREYEVYVLNMFAKGCAMTASEKASAIQQDILSDPAFSVIQNGHPISRYSQLFKKIALHRNARQIVAIYGFLVSFRNNFSSIYRQMRKQIYRH